MSFTDAFPEKDAVPPQIPGQPVPGASQLNGMRRQQLHDIARGYDIKVVPDGTKPEILPALIEAEQAGVFTRPPVRPEYLVKASRTADDPSVDWQSHAIPGPPSVETSTFRELQQMAKAAGVNSFGKGADALRAVLAEKEAAA